MRKFFAFIIVLNLASVALAQTDVSKIAQRLKVFDTKGTGIIDQATADNGAGVYIDLRVFGPAGITPHYPISIDELLKIAGGGKGSESRRASGGAAKHCGSAASKWGFRFHCRS